MREIDLRYFLEDEEPAPAAGTPVLVDDARAPVPADDASLAGKLERVAATALDKLDQVLSIPLLDPSDPAFGNVSRAQTAAANTAINAQLRVGEAAMRARRDDVMPRLLDILEREERKLDLSEHKRDRISGPNTTLDDEKEAKRK
jgi:hypothetical protein